MACHWLVNQAGPLREFRYPHLPSLGPLSRLGLGRRLLAVVADDDFTLTRIFFLYEYVLQEMLRN